MSLKNQTVFITGASRGIGRAIALRCARDGANVVIAAKSEEPHVLETVSAVTLLLAVLAVQTDQEKCYCRHSFQNIRFMPRWFDMTIRLSLPRSSRSGKVPAFRPIPIKPCCAQKLPGWLKL